ncbi:hypothetical protein VPG91_20490 [Nitrospirillum amazonense]|uniref:hypothetical protein n=1 Tax=Nitrospirillum amazonense TaxID=28077 RepID=UPI002DD44C1F|nr:hypothetical protein [Nitrospirillum amazonense]MEC4593394.1 hypothetical protein [Nitrospirillum amazonense]
MPLAVHDAPPGADPMASPPPPALSRAMPLRPLMLEPPRADGISHAAADRPARDTAAWSDETDALHLLPLHLLPLTVNGLKRARLVKTARLETMVELFRDARAGTGLIQIEGLGREFAADKMSLDRDMALLLKLGAVASFDVYSLRIELRALGIAVDEHQHLVLSPEKQEELTQYMQGFTRPLLRRVYGEQAARVENMGDLTALLSSPDRAETLANLRHIAGRLGLKLTEIPEFLAQYGDIFLSVAYFRSCRDGAHALLEEFGRWLVDLKRAPLVQTDSAAQRLITTVDTSLDIIMAQLEGCFRSFDRMTRQLWDDLSAEGFQAMRREIEAHHTSVGALCCGLAVKLGGWKRAFPTAGRGAPGQKLDWLRQEMVPGLAQLVETGLAANGRRAPVAVQPRPA